MIMKKIFQYSLAALAGLVLASCKGDYTDWASPQSYNQDDPVAAYGVTTTPSSITMPVDNDDVTLFSFSSSDERVKGYNIRSLTVNGQKIDYTVNGNNVIASANTLEDIAEITNESRAQDTYNLEVNTEFGVVLGNGDAVAGKANVTSNITTGETPDIDPEGYFLLGDFAENGNGWDLKKPVKMTDNGDGTYSAIVNTKNDGDNWFKFYEQSHYSDSDWDEVNLGQMGCKENGCSDRKGLLIWTGDKYEVQTPVISGKGEFKVTIDMVNFNYKIVRQAVNYYIIGGPNDWDKSCAEKSLKFNQADIEVPVYTILFPAAETGDTWFAIGDEQACDAVAKDKNWKLVYGTTSGNGNQGEKGTLKRRSELTDDGSFKIAEGAKFIQVTLDMSDNSYTVKAVNFSEYIYEAGNNNGWGSPVDYLNGGNFDGKYVGFMYLDGEFKFRSHEDTWDEPDWGAGATEGTLAEKGSNLSAEAGYYQVNADLAAMTYSLTPITTIGIVGPAQEGGWDADTDMTYNQETGAWETTIDLKADEMKFRANDGWDINWGGTEEALTQGGANIKIAEAGSYFVQLFAYCDGKAYCKITKQ